MKTFYNVVLPGIDSWDAVTDLEETPTGVKFTLLDGSKVTIRRGGHPLVIRQLASPSIEEVSK
jgi:hypothetical protein